MRTNNQEPNATGKSSRANRKTEAFPAATPPTPTGGSVPEETVGGTAGTTDQQGGNIVKHVYSVSSKVDGLYYYDSLYDNADVFWSCVRDYPIVPPEEGIKDYYEQGSFRLYARDLLNEYFSEEEAKALQTYLSRFEEITETTIKKVDLPLQTDGRCILQYSDDVYNPRRHMWEPAGWNENALPFTVWGCCGISEAVRRQPSGCPCPTCGKRD